MSSDRQVTASLTTIAAPSYAMPAVAVGRDWAAGMVGAGVALGGGYSALVAFRGQIGQDGTTAYGGQLSLSVAF